MPGKLEVKIMDNRFIFSVGERTANLGVKYDWYSPQMSVAQFLAQFLDLAGF